MPQHPGIWEKGQGWFTTPTFSEPEVSPYRRHRPGRSASTSSTRKCFADAAALDSRPACDPSSTGRRGVMGHADMNKLGWTATTRSPGGAARSSTADVVAACLRIRPPLGDKMTGVTCAGTGYRDRPRKAAPATGIPAPRGGQRLVHGRNKGSQAVVRGRPPRQTGCGLELMDSGPGPAGMC